MKFIKHVLLFLFFAVETLHAGAQMFWGVGGTIPDNGNSVDFIIPVTGLPNTIDTISFGVETVCIDLVHTWDSDLDIWLVAPDGSMVLLTSANGGGDDNYTNTCFNQFSPDPVSQGVAPFTGTFRPQGQLGIVNNGQDPNGIWKLHILDTYPFADQGTLFTWNITFGTTPATAFMLESSNLPIIKINTHAQGIPNEPKITADMGIIYNGAGIRNYTTDSSNNYNGKVAIEIRGHSSQMFPQKQYSFETRDSLGNELDMSLLGLPAEHDWILYAPYNDKTNVRNSLTYYLSNAMGRYASRCVFCEVIIDGEYKGIYILMEKIKRDANRVDIAKLLPTDTAGIDLTGGYICSIDWPDNDGWISNYLPDQTNPQSNQVYYQYIYPKDSDIIPVQKTYIQQYVDSFETALSAAYYQSIDSGWRKYADEYAFIDYFILNELSKNVDGYRLSTYFFKDKDVNGGKLKMGPAWDFNLAWHNADYCNNEQFGGWAYKLTDYCQWDFPFWWRRLMTDANFKNHLKCRWTQLRSTVLDTTYMFAYIDSMHVYLNEAQQRHFTIWPILGTYVWPNPSPLATTYQQEINNLKAWIRVRVLFLDSNIPGTCISTGETELTATNNFMVYPNPANSFITVSNYSTYQKVHLKIFDAMGKEISESELNGDEYKLDVSKLSSGIYFIQFLHNNELIEVKRFVKE